MVEVNEATAADAARRVKAGELPGPAKSLAEAMCRVMEQVGYVQKDKQMQGGGSYRYASVEAVIDKLRPEMLRQGITLVPVDMQPITVEAFEGKNGGRQNRTQLRVTFQLTHAASGQTQPVVTIGEAIDVGDKSSNKAMTAARKYALILAFNIETGNDPDDTPSHTQERATVPPPAKQPDETVYRMLGGMLDKAADADQLHAAGEELRRQRGRLTQPQLDDLIGRGKAAQKRLGIPAAK